MAHAKAFMKKQTRVLEDGMVDFQSETIATTSCQLDGGDTTHFISIAGHLLFKSFPSEFMLM